MKPSLFTRLPLVIAIAFAIAVSAHAKTQKAEFLEGPLPQFEAGWKPREGKVLMALYVDEEGYVKHAEVRSASDEYLIDPCRTAVFKWRFIAARKNGQPVSAVVLQRFNFDSEF